MERAFASSGAIYRRLGDDEVDDQSDAGDHVSRPFSRELFEEQDVVQEEIPWWKANFFIKEPMRFGTWDGTFNTVMINIFGVLVFLRMGWMVGYAGIGLAVLIIFITIVIGLVTTLSVIGLVTNYSGGSDRSEASGYDVFHMLSYVLGRKIGGVIGLLYAFGHAIAIALYAVGLGEAMSELFRWNGQWPIRAVAFVTATLLFILVLAGVKWVVKVQLVLLVCLGVAVFDFILGTFLRTAPGYGVLGYRADLVHNNTGPAFTKSTTFFTVFGVFFPSVTGIAGGLNMAKDLANPKRSVPIGTVSALAVSGFLWLVFSVLLGATCTRQALQSDSLIEYRVSLVGALFLVGLYISSLSSCLAMFYGAPRVLQSVGKCNVIPLLDVLGRGRGENEEPTTSTIVVAIVAYVFIFIGHLNTLAIVINMPFLMTYVALNYAFFAQAMSTPRKRLPSLYAKKADGTSDEEADESAEEEPLGSKEALLADNVIQEDASTRVDSRQSAWDDFRKSRPIPVSDDMNLRRRWQERTERIRPSALERLKQRLTVPEATRKKMADRTLGILHSMVNKWCSLAGAFLALLAMFLIEWAFALATLCFSFLLFVYIEHVSSGLPPGEADFKLFPWLLTLVHRFRSWLRGVDAELKPPTKGAVILTQAEVPFSYSLVQLTVDSPDYQDRDRRHQSVNRPQPTVGVRDSAGATSTRTPQPPSNQNQST